MKKLFNLIAEIPDTNHLYPATDEQVRHDERRLNVCFAEDYKSYTKKYGAIETPYYVMTGCVQSERKSVVTQTRKYRMTHDITGLYVIFHGIYGITALQDESGTVYISTNDTDPVPVYDSLYDFLEAFGFPPETCEA